MLLHVSMAGRRSKVELHLVFLISVKSSSVTLSKLGTDRWCIVDERRAEFLDILGVTLYLS